MEKACQTQKAYKPCKIEISPVEIKGLKAVIINKTNAFLKKLEHLGCKSTALAKLY